MKKIVWQDLETKKNLFTVRSAAMLDLASGKIIQLYLANTKIQVVQKTILNEHTFYRTESAKRKGLDWAFRASAFGLPDEKAPSAPSSFSRPNSLGNSNIFPESVSRTKSTRKQTENQTVVLPKDGEGRRHESWIKKLLRRKNGKTKNS